MFATDPRSDGPGIQTKVIQFADAAGSLPELFQDSSEFWNLRGMKLFKARRRTPEPLDNGLRVLDHSRFIADALRRDLRLPKKPEAFEVPIIYGNPNPTSQFLDISQVGPISVTVKQNIPSSLARLDLDSSLAERRLQFHYGNDAYQCMRSQHTSWQIVDVCLPLNEMMDNYPIVFCHPETFNETRVVVSFSGAPSSGRLVRHNQQQHWLCLANQIPAQVLVYRVASSNPDDPIGGPITSTNVTGNLLAKPEDRITIR